MITVGLTLFFVNIIFMVILNLNLLIAIISEEFDQIRSTQEVTRMKEKTAMIVEATVHQTYKLCGGKVKQVGMVTILSKKESEETTEFMGLTNRLSKQIVKSESNLNDKLGNIKSDFKNVKADFKTQIDTVKAELNDIKELILARLPKPNDASGNQENI